MRLIDADALKRDLTRFYEGEVTAKNLIDEQPTVVYAGEEHTPKRAETHGCVYCNEDECGFVKPIEKNGHAFLYRGMFEWNLELRAKGWKASVPIKFCPMCGRRLER